MIQKRIITLIAVIYLVGIIGHLSSDLVDIMLLLTPHTLFLSAGMVLFTSMRDFNRKTKIWLIIVYFSTFIIEIIGVQTGLIFGDYEYGKTLGISVLNVPLIIGINWVILILAAVSISSVIKDPIPKILMAGILTVALDMLIEPIAIELDYWTWGGGEIPLQNYIAWFIISVGVAFTHHKLKLDKPDIVLKFYYLVQLLFFGILNLVGIGVI